MTDNDFRDSEFRKQLTDTVKSLVALKVIPIFNENDAVSTRRAPYEVFMLCFSLLLILKSSFERYKKKKLLLNEMIRALFTV